MSVFSVSDTWKEEVTQARQWERVGKSERERERAIRRDRERYIYIYTHTYMLWGYYLVQVWPFWKLLSGPSLFFLKHRLPKNTIKIGVSALFFWKKKNCAQKFWKLLSGPSWRFLRCSQLGPDNNFQLGPDNNFQLGPDNNFQKCHFFCNFLLWKMC